MARGVNKVLLVGHLGDDPDLRYTQNQTPFCRMSLATNSVYTDREGNRVQNTEWHRVVAWGRLAENCAEYLSKGSLAYVEGALSTRKWEDESGTTQYTTEVKARTVEFLDPVAGASQNATPAAEAHVGEPPETYDAPLEDMPEPSDVDGTPF